MTERQKAILRVLYHSAEVLGQIDFWMFALVGLVFVVALAVLTARWSGKTALQD